MIIFLPSSQVLEGLHVKKKKKLPETLYLFL